MSCPKNYLKIVPLLLILQVSMVFAETIQIRVVNAKTGKSIPNELLSVSVKGERDAKSYRTDKDGIVSVELDAGASIFASTEWWITCRRISPGVMPWIPSATIINQGFTMENTCGDAKAETIKGKLILFARRASFFENMAR